MMEKFTDEQILDFYELIGLGKKRSFRAENILNLYELLEIEPKFNEDGSRQLTPYELLGIPPIFKDGREVPIIFTIKNRTRKIGKYEGQCVDFRYEAKKIKKEPSTIETLCRNFKRCALNGEDEKASEILGMIRSISDSAYRELVSHFFNYTKFYIKMKKQLLIDLFAHFFLCYIRAKIELMEVVDQIKNNKIKPFKIKEDLEKYIAENEDKITKLMTLTKKVNKFGMKKVEVHSSEGVSVAKLDINKEIEREPMMDISNASAKIQEIRNYADNLEKNNIEIQRQSVGIKSKLFGFFDKIVSGNQKLKSMINKKKKLSIFHPIEKQENLQNNLENENKTSNNEAEISRNFASENEKTNENSTF